MNNIIQKLKNIWAIEDLRTRILNTVIFLLVYVAGTQVLFFIVIDKDDTLPKF